jgi:DNA-binding response OmpR family regulator
MLGIDDPLQRSRLLRMGFGEALGWGASLDELEARLERLIERAGAVQRRRQVGALLLDLVAREAFVAGRALGLHPREFDLLWRLADDPGEELSATVLLGDVWRLRFRPETNSLAVHVSRLRAKLRLAGLDGLIETTSAAGYRLAAKQEPRWRGVAAAPPLGNVALDAHLRLREERLCEDS